MDLNAVAGDLSLSPSTTVNELENGASPQSGERLRRLCLGILNFLHTADSENHTFFRSASQLLRAEAEQQLSPMLEAGLRSIAGKMREELTALQQTVQHLEQLGGAENPFTPSLAAFPSEDTQEHRSSAPTPVNAATTNSTYRPLPFQTPSIPSPKDEEQTSDSSLEPTSLSSDAYEDLAQDFAKAGDWANAIEAASAALSQDPISIKALFIRGAAYFRENENYRALADLTKLLNREPEHVLAYNERGAVNACLERYDRALADYTTALRLKPQLTIARYNRAVVLLQAGKLDLALSAFNELARIWPEKAAVYFYRGRVHLFRNDPRSAIEDFQQALEIDPEQDRAIECLQEAKELQEQLRTEPPPAPSPPKVEGPAKPSTPKLEALPRPSSPKLEALPRPNIPDSKPKSSPKADEKIDQAHITMTCKGCGSSRQIPLDKLNRQFKCQKCLRIYFISQSGNLVEIKPPETKRKLLLRCLKVAAAAILLGAILVGVRFGWQKLDKGGVPQLPTELEARVQLMGAAWLQSDDSTMRLLTFGPQGRTLKYWLQDHPSPLSTSDHDKSLIGKETNVSLRILDEKRDSVQLVVIVNHPLASSPISINQEWVREGDTWYFKPFPDKSPYAVKHTKR